MERTLRHSAPPARLGSVATRTSAPERTALSASRLRSSGCLPERPGHPRTAASSTARGPPGAIGGGQQCRSQAENVKWTLPAGPTHQGSGGCGVWSGAGGAAARRRRGQAPDRQPAHRTVARASRCSPRSAPHAVDPATPAVRPSSAADSLGSSRGDLEKELDTKGVQALGDGCGGRAPRAVDEREGAVPQRRSLLAGPHATVPATSAVGPFGAPGRPLADEGGGSSRQGGGAGLAQRGGGRTTPALEELEGVRRTALFLQHSGQAARDEQEVRAAD